MSVLPAFIVDSSRRLPAGTVMPVDLAQTVDELPGRRTPGPHRVGKAEVMDDGRLALSLVDSPAGRTAAGLLDVDVVDVVVEGDPPSVWLRGGMSHVAVVVPPRRKVKR